MALSGLAPADYSTPWRQFELGGGFISSHGPSLDANGNGYFGRWVDNTVRRFDIESGVLTGTFAAGNFVVCTPAISGSRLFVSTDNANGKVFGIDRGSLFTDWLENTGYVSGSPIVGPEGDVVYVRTSGELTRRDAATGASVWSRTGYLNPKGPVVFTRDDQAVVIGHGNNVSAFRWSDGLPLWTFATTAPIGSPAVAPDGTIVVGNDGGRIYGINPNGTQRWLRFASAEVRAAPAFGPSGQVYVGSYDFSLYAFNVATGTPLWSYFGSGWVNSPPSVGHDGRVYFHNRTGDLYCLSPTGALVWQRKVGEESRGPLSIGTESRLYVPYAGSTVGGLTVIRQDAPTLYFDPLSFNPGVSGVGDPMNMRTVDGQTFNVQSSAVQPIASEVIAEFAASAPKAQLDSFSADLTLTAFGSGNLIFVPEIFDWSNATWVGVAKRQLTPGIPMTLSMLFPGSPSNAVDPVTKTVKIRFSIARYARPNTQWGVMVDRLTARIVPSF